MSLLGLRSAWHRLHCLRKQWVQECPPELSFCETCDRAYCTNERWLTCEKRLAVARQLEREQSAAGTVGPSS